MMEQPEQAPIRVWTVFFAFAVVVAVQIAGSLVIGLVWGLDEELVRSTGFLIVAALLSNLAFGGTALVAARVDRLAGESWSARLRWPRGPARTGHYVAGVVLVLAVSEVGDRIISLVQPEGGSLLHQMNEALQEASFTLYVSVMAPLLLAGLCEELFFRGYMQTRLGQRWSRGVAVIVSAGMFGLAHFDTVHSAAAMSIGLALGLLTEASGSIRPSVAAHCVNNLVAGLSARYLAQTWYARATWPALGFALLVVVASGLWLRRLAIDPEADSSKVR